MGGAAVIGLAVAFGAQNLIRDYFTGFMMLMEDQYSVNDVVRIGSISGLVELITLRMTVLRDLEGVRHFIPHGAVTSVSNLTHGWSRALLDVPVAYKENVDRVIDVLMELGREMRHHPVLGKHILEEPEMLGVDSFADSAVVIRFLLKTRPLQQWPIKREMLRRIKNRFDELGIEIPFPHRTIYHHYPEGMAGQTLPLTVGDRYVA
jgi:small conductance mechanosensitive channel